LRNFSSRFAFTQIKQDDVWPGWLTRSVVISTSTFCHFIQDNNNIHLFHTETNNQHSLPCSRQTSHASQQRRWLTAPIPVIYWMYVARCNFYRAMLCTERYSYSKLCVCLSVRNVEVLWSHRLEFLPGCSLSTDHNVTDLLQVEHPEILARIGVAGGHKKSGFWCTKALIFLKHGKMDQGYSCYYWGPRSSNTCFRLCQNQRPWMTYSIFYVGIIGFMFTYLLYFVITSCLFVHQGLNWISSLLQWPFAVVRFAAYTVESNILIDSSRGSQSSIYLHHVRK